VNLDFAGLLVSSLKRWCALRQKCKGQVKCRQGIGHRDAASTYRQRVGKEAQGNTELEIEYEKILNRVKKSRESVIRMTDRHFTAPVDEISGTVEEVSPGGITLKEFPGRVSQFSSVSTSAADMSARILGEHQVSSSCRTTKTSRARDRLKPHPAGHPCLPLPRSFFLSRRMEKHGSVSSSWCTQKPSRVRQAETHR
jgi:hypothetical protein